MPSPSRLLSGLSPPLYDWSGCRDNSWVWARASVKWTGNWNVSYLPAGSGGDCVGGRSSCQGGCSYDQGWRTGQGTVLASSRSRDLKISDKLTSVLHKGIFKRLFYPLTLTKLIIRGLWGCSFIIKILNLLRDFWELRWHQQTSYLMFWSYRVYNRQYRWYKEEIQWWKSPGDQSL